MSLKLSQPSFDAVVPGHVVVRGVRSDDAGLGERIGIQERIAVAVEEVAGRVDHFIAQQGVEVTNFESVLRAA